MRASLRAAPPQQTQQQAHSECEPNRQTDPRESSFRGGRPQFQCRADGEEKREDSEPEETRDGQTGEPGFAPHFLSHRARTNLTTASARFLGMSRGLSIFKVRPVAR